MPGGAARRAAGESTGGEVTVRHRRRSAAVLLLAAGLAAATSLSRGQPPPPDPGPAAGLIPPATELPPAPPGLPPPPGQETPRPPQDHPPPEAPRPPPPAAVPEVRAPNRSAASVAVDVIGPTQAAPGELIPFEVVIRNNGAMALSRLRLQTPLPPGVRLLDSDPPAQVQGDELVWELGPLAVAAQKRIHLDLQAVTPGELALAPAVTFTPQDALRTSIVPSRCGVLVKGPASVRPGETVRFEIEVANRADTPLERVTVQAQLPAGLTHPAADAKGRLAADLGSLPAGNNRTIALEVKAAAGGRQIMEVVLRAEGLAEVHSRAVVVVQETSLPLGLLAQGPRQAAVGHDLEVRLEVSNPQKTAANNVRLVQSVPQGLEVVSAGPGAVTAPGGQGLVWSLGTLTPGQKEVRICRLRPRAAGDWPLYAVLTGEGLGDAQASHSVHVEGPPPLALEVLARDEVLTVGAETVYEVRVRNPGSVPATNVHLQVLVPEEVVPLQPQGPTEAQVQPARVLFGPLPRLESQAEAVYQVRVRGKRPGQGRLQLELSADQLARPVVEEVGATVVE